MKQVIIIRQDLKMDKGKLAVQCSHASVDCVLKTDRRIIDEWKKEGMKKVVVKVEDEKELMKYKKIADSLRLKNSLIKDAGKTFFKEATITCLGIGPDDDEKIDRVSGKLKMV